MVSTLPVPARAVDHAKLPILYEEARRALSKCARFDECREWTNRAHAFASYARQAKDKSLLRYAMTVQARAVRRVGELLNAVEPQRNQWGGKPTKKETAAAAGLSRDQARTAQRVARVSEARFEKALESDKISVLALARIGTVKRAAVLPPEHIMRARAHVRLKKALRELEDVAADLAELESAPEYFGRLLKRDATLRSQLKHARIFIAHLEEWM